jgi:drug/metabolite transporter (DMT)-like permease
VSPAFRLALAWVFLFSMPAFFAVNHLVARSVDFMTPHAMTLGRWTLAFVFLLPFVGAGLWRKRTALGREAWQLLILGTLGMWICGAFVYLGARTTTATNIGLIYAACPVGIVIIARIFLAERLAAPQVAGIALCLSGLLLILMKGEPARLLAVEFTRGDLWIAASALSWSIYTVLLKRWSSALDATERLTAAIGAGALILLPITALEAAIVGPPPLDWRTLAAWLILAIVPGVAAYGAFSFTLRELGAGRTAIYMYLGPLYTAALAWLVLAEQPSWYHVAGAALILPGIFLATRAPPQPSG